MVTSSVLSCKPLKDTQNMLLRLDRQIGTNFERLLQAAAATVAHAAQTRCNEDEDRNQMPRNSMLDQALTRLIAHRSKFPSASRRQHLSCRRTGPGGGHFLNCGHSPPRKQPGHLGSARRSKRLGPLRVCEVRCWLADFYGASPGTSRRRQHCRTGDPGVRRTNGPTSPAIRRCSSPERELQRRRP